MKGQTVQSNEGKSQGNKITVVCNWSYSKETTPSFCKFMRRLLQARRDPMKMDNGYKQEF